VVRRTVSYCSTDMSSLSQRVLPFWKHCNKSLIISADGSCSRLFYTGPIVKTVFVGESHGEIIDKRLARERASRLGQFESDKFKLFRRKATKRQDFV
jgi:hypothetical protein